MAEKPPPNMIPAVDTSPFFFTNGPPIDTAMRLPWSNPRKYSAKIGVTPTNGADMPRYRPSGPSLAIVFRKTSA
jgi:hypothetical protein